MNNRPIQRIGDYNDQQQRKSDVIFCNVVAFLFFFIIPLVIFLMTL